MKYQEFRKDVFVCRTSVTKQLKLVNLCIHIHGVEWHLDSRSLLSFHVLEL